MTSDIMFFFCVVGDGLYWTLLPRSFEKRSLLSCCCLACLFRDGNGTPLWLEYALSLPWCPIRPLMFIKPYKLDKGCWWLWWSCYYERCCDARPGPVWCYLPPKPVLVSFLKGFEFCYCKPVLYCSFYAFLASLANAFMACRPRNGSSWANIALFI